MLFDILFCCSIEVDITNELLLRLFDYTLEVKVWDSKEKLMTRTRFDKPQLMKSKFRVHRLYTLLCINTYSYIDTFIQRYKI